MPKWSCNRDAIETVVLDKISIFYTLTLSDLFSQQSDYINQALKTDTLNICMLSMEM